MVMGLILFVGAALREFLYEKLSVYLRVQTCITIDSSIIVDVP